MNLEVRGEAYIFLDYLGKDQACVVVSFGQHWRAKLAKDVLGSLFTHKDEEEEHS